MTHIIRITAHPDDPHIVLIHVPPNYSDTTIMGRLEAARWSPDDQAYLLHTDAIPGLRGLAQHVGAHLIDQRKTTDPRGRPTPQECRHCAQPGSWSHPPAHCPGCGKPWEPVPPPGDTPADHYPECKNCGHQQAGRFPYCTNCGSALPDHQPTRSQLAPTTDTTRPHLDDPMPLAQTLDDIKRTLRP